MQPPRTAYPATESALRAAVADAPLDRESFERPLARCSLARCHGTCCSEGVYLNAEVAATVRNLLRRDGELFRSLGMERPEDAVVEEVEDGVRSVRTALRPKPFRARVPDYPAHFPETACAFLLDDARCALQVAAEAKGLHPWHYKPLACWLHPVSISPEGIRLHDRSSDPYPDGWTSETHCGRTEPCGRPAREVLGAELEFLGGILGRDLLAADEVPAPAQDARRPT
ncbi:MAG TPA: hypothetical protein VGV85_00200 [Longimicrobiaceae bacterium]|nr:hypothetical protein [Longimicrobiaceae bacterium]